MVATLHHLLSVHHIHSHKNADAFKHSRTGHTAPAVHTQIFVPVCMHGAMGRDCMMPITMAALRAWAHEQRLIQHPGLSTTNWLWHPCSMYISRGHVMQTATTRIPRSQTASIRRAQQRRPCGLHHTARHNGVSAWGKRGRTWSLESGRTSRSAWMALLWGSSSDVSSARVPTARTSSGRSRRHLIRLSFCSFRNEPRDCGRSSMEPWRWR